MFANKVRTDRTPKKANETMFGFLDRTGSTYFEPVRDLLETWVGRVPAAHRASITGNLMGGDGAFEGALWELYLYVVTTGSGADVEIHPDIPGNPNHPDFLVYGADPYYMEAVAVGRRPKEIAADRRLRDVEAVLDQVRVNGATLSFAYHQVGPRPISAVKLRDRLVRWIDSLDLTEMVESRAFRASASRSIFQFEDDGWVLTFEALPTNRERPRGAPLIGIRGSGRAKGVDNTTGLRRVLDSKANKYGTQLRYPLVTSVLSNTEFPTRDYDVAAVLYGSAALPPVSVVDLRDLHTEGHWRTARGWRRSHNPNVIVAAGLKLHNLGFVTPKLWSTLDPTAVVIPDVQWADPVDVSMSDPQPLGRRPALGALGIDAHWCAGSPDFDD